jgi:hypothetical protein
VAALAFSYDDVVDASIRVTWQIDDIMPAGTVIQFDRPHLPDSLADVEQVSVLSESEKITLNHLRGLSYMHLFAFVEEYIIAQVVHHAEAELFGDQDALRALLRFGEEEVKHQTLFKRYCIAFQRDFGRECKLLGSASEVANIILANSPMAVMLVTLHLEIITQQHYTDAIKDDADIDPLFTSILMHHWMEESQHTRIDLLELEKMNQFAIQETRDKAIAEYFGILDAFDGLLAQQVEFDIDNLEAAVGRKLNDADRANLRSHQHRSYRKDYLLMGLNNRKVVAAMVGLDPDIERKIEEIAASYR